MRIFPVKFCLSKMVDSKESPSGALLLEIISRGFEEECDRYGWFFSQKRL